MKEILEFPGIDEIISLESFKKRLRGNRKLRVKFGADPSRPDIHLGHSVVLRLLRSFQKAGHQVIFLIGDYTAMIGDPTGRNKTRPILSESEIKSNAKTYLNQVGKILDLKKTEIRYNSEWFCKLSFADILKIAGSFTVSGIIERDDFQKRLKSKTEIGLHELLYPVMQAYDSVILRADIEIGGSDQKFNLLAGRELQKKLGQEAQEIITTELLVGTDGHEKMSKSYDNYIGIAEAPEEIFGKIMSIKDEQIIEYFRLLTDLSPKKVENIKADLLSGANPKYIKYQLGLEITTLYCGAGEAKKAGERFDLIHKLKETPKDIPEVTLSGSFELAKLVSTLGLARSVSEAYRLIVQGGVRIDEAKIVDPKNLIKVYPGMIIQVGKRKFIKIK